MPRSVRTVSRLWIDLQRALVIVHGFGILLCVAIQVADFMKQLGIVRFSLDPLPLLPAARSRTTQRPVRSSSSQTSSDFVSVIEVSLRSPGEPVYFFTGNCSAGRAFASAIALQFSNNGSTCLSSMRFMSSSEGICCATGAAEAVCCVGTVIPFAFRSS